MFDGARVFDQPLGDWDVSSVVNFGGMFGPGNFTGEGIGNWVINPAADMGGMFYQGSLNQDLSGWCVAHLGPFDDAEAEYGWTNAGTCLPLPPPNPNNPNPN